MFLSFKHNDKNHLNHSSNKELLFKKYLFQNRFYNYFEIITALIDINYFFSDWW